MSRYVVAMHKSGAELAEAREAAGLTQEQIATALGLHRVTIAVWESRARIPAAKANRYLRAVSDLASQAEGAA